MDRPQPLDYAPRVRKSLPRWWKHAVAVTLCLAAIIAVVVKFELYEDPSRPWRYIVEMRRWSRWANHTAAADHIVWSETKDPIAPAGLKVLCEPWPEEWARYNATARQTAIVFLHRRSVNGSPYLVSVEYVPATPKGHGPHFAARIEAGNGPRGRYWGPFVALDAPWLTGKPKRIFAGQVDSKDESHFTIRFEIDGREGVLDGWLVSPGPFVPPTSLRSPFPSSQQRGYWLPATVRTNCAA